MEHRATEIAAFASYSTSLTGFAVGSFIASHLVQVVTIALGIATFAVQLLFTRARNAREARREAREKERHRAHMKAIKQQLEQAEKAIQNGQVKQNADS